MALSVRVDPILERQLELAAKRQGITKSQFVLDAVRRALGQKDPYDLMLKLIAEEESRTPPEVAKAFDGYEKPYETVSTRKALIAKLKRSMASAALVDASAIVAAFGTAQRHTARYQGLFKLAREERWALGTTWPCVVEASHLLGAARRHAMLRWVAHGAVSVFPFAQEQLEDMVKLMQRYTESPRTNMDFADASLVWLAADTGVTSIMTLDRRDFSRYRLPDGRSFDVL